MKTLGLVILALFFSDVSFAQIYSTEHINTPDGGKVCCLAMSPAGRMFAATMHGSVYYSDDEGLNWSFSNIQASWEISAFAFSPSGIIYLRSDWALYKSIDNGINWTIVLGDNIGAIACDPFSERIYVGCSNLKSSDDGGLTWVNHLDVPSAGQTLVDDSGYVFCGSNFNGVGLYRSTDNGITFHPFGNFAASIPLCESPNHSLYLATYSSGGTNLGLLRSSDHGTTWTQINFGLGDTCPYQMICTSTYTYIQVEGRIFRSGDDGNTWSELLVNLPSVYFYTFLVDEQDNFFAGTTGAGVYFSNDLGQSWTTRDHQLAATTIISLKESDDHIFYAATAFSGIFKSQDGGFNWTAINDSFGWSIGDIAVKHDSIIVVGTYDGRAYESCDSGKSWKKIFDSAFHQVYCVGITDDEEILLGTNHGVYLSVDKGISFNNIYYLSSVEEIIIKDSLWFFSSTYLGKIFLTANKGNSWQIDFENSIESKICTDKEGNVIAWLWESGGTNSLYSYDVNSSSWVLQMENPTSPPSIDPYTNDYYFNDGALYVSHNEGATLTQMNFDGATPKGNLFFNQSGDIFFYGNSGIDHLITAAPASIPNTSSEANFSVAPNPSDKFIVFSKPIQDVCTAIQIFSLSGQLVKSFDYGSVSNDEARIFIGDLADGMYLLNVTSSEQSATTKFSVSHSR